MLCTNDSIVHVSVYILTLCSIISAAFNFDADIFTLCHERNAMISKSVPPVSFCYSAAELYEAIFTSVQMGVVEMVFKACSA